MKIGLFKRITGLALALAIMLTFMPTFIVYAATDINNAKVFVKQSKGGRCTLAAAVMMMRRHAILDGSDEWSTITESSTLSSAWTDGIGLNGSFEYGGLKVKMGYFSGSASDKKKQLISLLEQHPEGVEIYQQNYHAVVATDYTSGVIYCADPSTAIASGRVPLTDAWMKGKTQNDRIGNLSTYWIVKSGKFTPPDNPTPAQHTHKWTKANESEHPHKQYRICSVCGEKQYTGEKTTIKSCKKCYPLDTSAKLETAPNKTKGTATLKWNIIKNATDYKVDVFKDGKAFKSETFSKTETSVSLTRLEGGTYTAQLTANNSNTGEKRVLNFDKFTIVDTYSVAYNANGGSSAPSSQLKIKDVDLTLSTTVPSREGYDFLGWSRTKKATEPEYTAGGKFTLNTKVTLYAVWTPKTYTVSFDVNGGKGDTESVTITHGNVMRMPNTVVRDSYYLKGWAKTKNADSPDYRLGMDYAITSDVILYAIWGKSTWDEGTEPFQDGDGTAENPYQISNSKQLAYLADKVNNQHSEPTYEYYILTDNIDLGGKEWRPIGLYETTNQYFKGSFDGKGYTISNLSITDLNNGYIGLFGYTKDSEIKNLNISGGINGIVSTGVVKVGAIAGNSLNLTADNCVGLDINVSNISSAPTTNDNYSHVGAMFGYAVNGSKISNCLAKDCYVGVKKGLYRIGVIVGGANGSITNCHVTSDVELIGSDSTVEEVFCGGIAGSISGQIKTSDVEAKYLSGRLQTTGKLYAGGLVGWLNSGAVECCAVKFTDGLTRTIDNGSYKASIIGRTTATTGTNYSVVGGVVGVSKVTATISDCKYEGDSLVSTSGGVNAYAGGLIGYDNGTDSNIVGINRCFANVNGIVYAEAPNTTGAGGAIGRIGHTESVESKAQNIIAKADRVSAKTTISSKYANAGDIFANRTYNTYNFSNAASWSSIDLSSVNTGDTNKANIQYTGSNWTENYFKKQTELSKIFGTPYQSIAYIKENPDAVWVINDGQYPELYFTVLRDITLSEVEHGTISVDKSHAIDGEIVTVTVEPDDDYTFNKLYVNGEEKVGKTFEVSGDSEVYATFAELPAEYSVEVQSAENAAASLTNVDEVSLQSVSLFSITTSLTATDGEEIRVDTQSDEDYNVEAVYVNGEEMASDSFVVTENSIVTMDVKNVSTDIEAITYEPIMVGRYWAVLGGKVDSYGDGITKYIQYWSEENEEEVYTTEIEEIGGEYEVLVYDLLPDTKYYYQMTENGAIKTFTTSNEEDDPDYGNNTEPVEHIQREICFNIQNTSVNNSTVTTDILNISEEVQSGLVIFASYNSSNALVKVETQDIDELETNGTLPIEFDLPEGAEKYKILVWDSWKTMLPIATSVHNE